MQYIQTNTSLYKEIGFLFWTFTNFKNWKNDVMITLAYANVEIAITEPKPLEEDAKQFQAWNTSNRVCAMTLKRVILEVYQGELENTST